MLITFEGTEGSGKSTQAKMLYDFLRSKNIKTVLTKEPGGTKIGEKCRELLLHANNENISDETELLLFFADRAQHVKDVVWPNLLKEKIVIIDRYYDTTHVYQKHIKQYDNFIIQALMAFTNTPTPDITYLIDIPVEKGLDRALKRNVEKNIDKMEGRFDRKNIEFHKKVKDGYEKLYIQNKDRIVKINGDKQPDEVFETVYDHYCNLTYKTNTKHYCESTYK